MRIFLPVDDGVLTDGNGRGEDLGHVDVDPQRVGLHQIEQRPGFAGVVRRDQRSRIDRPRRYDAGKGGGDLLKRLQVRVLPHGRPIGLDVRLARFDLRGRRLDLRPVLIDGLQRGGRTYARFDVPIDRDLCQFAVGFGDMEIGLGQDEVGAGLASWS